MRIGAGLCFFASAQGISMTQKVFLSEKNTAKLICIACNRSYEADMSAYLNYPNTAKIKAKCKCGHTWSVVLEKRRYFRKRVKLAGTYKYHITGKTISEGMMTVLDLSRKGLRMKIHGQHNLKDGDWVEVEFRLDNSIRSLVNRIVNIKNISGEYVGASFREIKQFDPVIGFYMLQHTPPQEKQNDGLLLKAEI
jgi:hypothetical protein